MLRLRAPSQARLHKAFATDPVYVATSRAAVLPVRPPTVRVKLMHEGYDRDDIYIMVEDEFQSVAQSHTAHLHRAEYKRLTKKAREAAARPLPEPTAAMPADSRRRLKTLALHRQQRDTLHQVVGRPSTNGDGDEDEEEDDDDEQKVADLWSGTSLAPLMSSSGQQKTSLLGLERISSSTKAAMGVRREPSATHVSPPRPGAPGTADGVDRRVPTHRPEKRKVSQIEEESTSTSRSSTTVNRHSTNGPQLLGSPKRKSHLTQQMEREQERKARLEEIPLFLS